jgi:hypothetical protein
MINPMQGGHEYRTTLGKWLHASNFAKALGLLFPLKMVATIEFDAGTLDKG